MNQPLDSPFHGQVSDNHRGNPVKDLKAGSSEGVEDGVVESSGEGTLSVGAEAV